jgi:hypothetical protein
MTAAHQALHVVAPGAGTKLRSISGDIVAIAEVVRDLYRSESQPELSYSERQLYERRSAACRARSRWCSMSPRPRRSKRSKGSLRRARGVGRHEPI